MATREWAMAYFVLYEWYIAHQIFFLTQHFQGKIRALVAFVRLPDFGL